MNDISTLQRSEVTMPRLNQKAVTFSSTEKAVEHLTNHVLVSPECLGWGELLKDWASLLKLETDSQRTAESGAPVESRTNFIQRTRQTKGCYAQELFNDWIEELKHQQKTADELDWIDHDRNRNHLDCFSIHGVRMVYGPAQGEENHSYSWALLTAHIPGKGSAEEVKSSQEENRTRRDQDPFQNRERGRSRRSRRSPDRSYQERAADRKRREKWTSDEHHYHSFFKPAIRYLKSRANSHADPEGIQTDSRIQEIKRLWKKIKPTRPKNREEWSRMKNLIYRVSEEPSGNDHSEKQEAT